MDDLRPEPVFVCVHVPEFPAQARLRLRPEQACLPVAILGGDPPFEYVCSANRRALSLGVAHGTTRTELASYPGVTLLRRSPDEECAARTALLGVAATFTPRAEIYAVDPAESSSFALVLDMSGTTRVFGELKDMQSRVSRAFRALRISTKLAVSANFHTAVLAAPFADKSPWMIIADREEQALGGLPIRALPLTEDERTTFEMWGVRTLGELAHLPEAEVVVRLGQAGRRLHELARGEHPHLMVPLEDPLRFEECIAFDTPVDNLDSLLFVLGPMLKQLLIQAQTHALGLASLTVRFVLDGAGDHVRSVRPALPSDRKDVLLKLLQLDLQAQPPSAAVIQIHLQAQPGKRSKVQTDLFGPPLPEAMELDVMLARLQALVGAERVGKAALLDAHRSEAFCMEPFTVPTTVPQQRPVAAAVALRRLRPPMSLSVELAAHRPCSFMFDNTRYEIAEAYGPWRRSGDWWSEDVWSREEWDVCARSSCGMSLLGVLSQDLLRRGWQMDALYD